LCSDFANANNTIFTKVTHDTWNINTPGNTRNVFKPVQSSES
jgi:hypothetical protein